MMKDILFIDKEVGWTSHDVVAWIRSRISEVRDQNGNVGYEISKQPKAHSKKLKIKVGHTGTLDPFATGLLIILIGREATKRQSEFLKMDKEYEATLELGKVSSTGDTEGKVQEIINSKIQIPNKSQISNLLNDFIGEIDQIPPAYSAIKMNGKKAYELARKGIDPKLKSRKVQIYDIEIIGYQWPLLKLKIKCGSGAYIRSLARDIGEALGIGAYLIELRRTKIGKFSVQNAKKIKEVRLN